MKTKPPRPWPSRFVTFEHSQYWPFHHHLAIEPESDFIVYFTDSEVRRSGSMTPAQKRQRERREAATAALTRRPC
jgi:hypothetical protein